ncbi:MAG: hypothetical protein ACNA8W_10320 [Bradymonadaceae bacterium]
MDTNGFNRALFKGPVWLIAASLLLMTMGCSDDDDPPPPPTPDVVDVVDDIGDDVDVMPPDVPDVVDDIDVIIPPDVAPDVEPDVVPDVPAPGTARLQIIHDVTDDLAETIDVYLDGELFLDDFEYGQGTGFMEVQADQAYSIALAGSESDTVADAFITLGPFTFEDGTRNVLIVSGVLDPDDFEDNPEGIDISTRVFTFDEARQSSTDGDVDQVLLFHGVTDAAPVSIVAAGHEEALVEDLSYGEFSDDYIDLPEGVTAFDVMVNGDRVGSWQTHDVTGGNAYVFVITGFADASQNPDAPIRILSYASADANDRIDGERLTRAARVQLVHNSPDPNLETIDVWINDQRRAEGFGFRDGTSYITVASNTDLTIDLTAEGAADTGESVFAETLSFEAASTNVAVVSGIDTENDITNPDDLGIDLNVYTADNVREAPAPEENLELVLFHGIADAGSVDIVIAHDTDPVTIADDLSYGEFTERRAVAAEASQFDLSPTGEATPTASFPASLQDFDGQSLVMVLSGLLDPPTDYPGAALLVITPEGDVTVIEP